MSICCKKCRGEINVDIGENRNNFHSTWMCKHPDCSCHQPPTEETKSPDSLPSQIPDKLTSSRDSLEWENQFLKLCDGEYGYIHQKGHHKLVSFIKQQITKAKEEERARIRGVIEELRLQNKEAKPADHIEEVDERAYAAALTDILKEIGE